ncbi:MAG: hypothetical protein K1W14_00620 [Muribaculaceae bacterium]|jgi:hypothetical protein
MKTMKYVLSLLMIFMLVGCGNDEPKEEKEEKDLSTVPIYQTMWEGTFIGRAGKNPQAIKLQFELQSYGMLLYSSDNDNKFDSKNSFQYYRNGQVLTIVGVGGDWWNDKSGEWWIMSYDGTHMTLTTDPGSTTELTMKLTRVFE